MSYRQSAAFVAAFLVSAISAQSQERPAQTPASPRESAPAKPAANARPLERPEALKPAKSEKPSGKAAVPPAAPAMQRGQALFLIRTSLLTLNDANKSGNYTVLRDLAAPGFRDANTSADLAGIFSDLRRRGFDLFGVAVLEPELTSEPIIGADGLLHLTGRFNTRPLLIAFDMLFQIVNGQWRLFGLSVQTPAAGEQKASTPGISPAIDQVPPPLGVTPEWAPAPK